ncbi:MAG: exosortase [Planctomycetaceae bacterium]|nr:exosortase [Planctomycetaceae bacterium]
MTQDQPDAQEPELKKPSKALPKFNDPQFSAWLMIGVLSGLVILCYLNTLIGTAVAWDTPMYSHGYLIPLIAIGLLYYRREKFQPSTNVERWWGVGIILFATIMRVVASILVQFSIDRISFIACLIGVFVMVGGFRTLRWAGPAIAFLIFMFPLPRVLVDNILRPMQTMATISSVYALQTFGVDVYREGNRIILEHTPMNVVDQCSGLRMLTIFIAIAVAIVMISNQRPPWERILILISSVPIALLVNCIRITITGLLYNLEIGAEEVDVIFHDFAGIIMMPLALGFLLIEMQVLSRLFIEDTSSRQVNVGIG